MLKKLIPFIICVTCILSLFPTSVFADTDGEKTEPITVTSYEELISALGGEGVVLRDDKLIIVKDIALKAPIHIVSGSYTLVGEGAVITADYKDGDFFIISGKDTSLSVGDRYAPEEKRDLVFDGEGGEKIREGSVFFVEESARLELFPCVVIEDAVTTVSGAAVYNEGAFTMYGGEIASCRAVSSGGAVYNSGSAAFTSGKITSCSANHGGLVYSDGESAFAGTTLEKGSATNGGAIFNAGELKFVSSSVTDCKASRGGGIYNSGKAEITGGSISSCSAENGEGGGVYNASELEASGSPISENSAKNGGNVYNTATLTMGDELYLYGGKASENGGNVYNAEEGTFTFASGSISGGIAVYGGGLYNLGTFTHAGGGFYGNSAEVGDGVLNHGEMTLKGTGYCGTNDSFFVVINPDLSHAITVDAEWTQKTKPSPISCGIYENGKYFYRHSVGDKLLDIKGETQADKSFTFYDSKAGLVLSPDGALAKAPTEVPKAVLTVLAVIAAYAAVTAAMVFAIRYLDKKKLAR